ncbi:unnamed protein product [Effrenium voratum]|uniref:Uncharacterized protein n=1 Tax=Effrenium voratum TaxID=2562239 RepID=A0AA36ISG1_9DINO|nr:unnamed protein product [Effrenium voratum]
MTQHSYQTQMQMDRARRLGRLHHPISAANGERALPVLRLPVRRGQAGDVAGHGCGPRRQGSAPCRDGAIRDHRLLLLGSLGPEGLRL